MQVNFSFEDSFRRLRNTCSRRLVKISAAVKFDLYRRLECIADDILDGRSIVNILSFV